METIELGIRRKHNYELFEGKYTDSNITKQRVTNLRVTIVRRYLLAVEIGEEVDGKAEIQVTEVEMGRESTCKSS